MRSVSFGSFGSLVSLVLLMVVPCCATIGSDGQGDVDLPTAGIGPFRALVKSELRATPPFVLVDVAAHFREPSALAATSDPNSSNVYVFAVAHVVGANMKSTDVIARTRADDARSFYGSSDDHGHSPHVVLSPDAPWEGASLGGPSAIRVGAQIWLYYAAAGGIGLARSDDGLAFTKDAQPVLAPDATVAWEKGSPSAPSVAQYPDGSYRMLYASGGAMGEAESTDGVTWKRRDADPSTPAIDPVFGPSFPVDPSKLAPGEKPPFDSAAVGDPCLLPQITAGGRLQVRVLYTGFDGTGQSAIGFAARYGDSGILYRDTAPVYAVGKHEAAPALFVWSGGVLLYVHQDDGTFPAIAGAFAPPTLTLGLPADYAADP